MLSKIKIVRVVGIYSVAVLCFLSAGCPDFSSVKNTEKKQYTIILHDEPINRDALYTLARISFREGKLDEAEAHLTKYQEFYPDSALMEEVLWMMASIRYRQLQPYDRDQSKSEELVDRVKKFQERFPGSLHSDTLDAMQNDAIQRMTHAEFSIAEFYFRRGVTLAAKRRFEKVLESPYKSREFDAKARAYLLRIDEMFADAEKKVGAIR